VPEEYYQQWEEENRAEAAAEKALASVKDATPVAVKEENKPVETVPAEPKPKPEGAAKRKATETSIEGRPTTRLDYMYVLE
jgi:hypothetical protein